MGPGRAGHEPGESHQKVLELWGTVQSLCTPEISNSSLRAMPRASQWGQALHLVSECSLWLPSLDPVFLCLDPLPAPPIPSRRDLRGFWASSELLGQDPIQLRVEPRVAQGMFA